MPSPLKFIRTYASFVKFAHTVFALPFALVGMFAAYALPIKVEIAAFYWEGVFVPSYLEFEWVVLLLILACMVGARSFAMAVNRIVDRRIDALNPRTAVREIPAGKLSPSQARIFAVLAAALYFGSCFSLGPTVLTLSPVPIALMILYPYTKRFTAACHLVLGASLGLAPVGAWVAVRSFDPPALLLEHDPTSIGWAAVIEPVPWLLGGAVALWVAGFDVIYALQDDEFDREQGLHSIPARFGRVKALWISRAIHLVSGALFVLFIRFTEFGTNISTLPEEIELPTFVYLAAGIVILGMFIQQALVSATNLKHVNLAFFTVNGMLSVAFLAVFFAAFATGRWL